MYYLDVLMHCLLCIISDLLKVEPRKTVSDKRKGWMKQKQKSKSFDFSWKVGSLWSPVEDRKSYQREIILMQSEPRKPRPKPPSVLELDSGSSYESHDIQLGGHPMIHVTTMPRETKVKKETHGMRIEKQQPVPETTPETGAPLLYIEPVITITHPPLSPSDRRRLIFQNRKSHSLDSSLEEYQNQVAQREAEKQYQPEERMPPPEERESHRGPLKSSRGSEGSQDKYTSMHIKDKRLKLQEQRRSRSLDTYNPKNYGIHVDSKELPQSVIDTLLECYEKVRAQRAMAPLARRTRDLLGADRHEKLTADTQGGTKASRRASDVISAKSNRRPSDAVSPNRRSSEVVTASRRASDIAGISSGSRRPSEGRALRRMADVGSSGAAWPPAPSSSSRRPSDIAAASHSPRRSSEVVARTTEIGPGSSDMGPSTAASRKQREISPGSHPSRKSREQTDTFRRSGERMQSPPRKTGDQATAPTSNRRSREKSQSPSRKTMEQASSRSSEHAPMLSRKNNSDKTQSQSRRSTEQSSPRRSTDQTPSPRRSTEFPPSPSRRSTEQLASPRRSTEHGASTISRRGGDQASLSRKTSDGKSPSSRKASESDSPTARRGDSGSGSPSSRRPSDIGTSGSPGRRPSDVPNVSSRRASEQVPPRKSSLAKKVFAQQKSFSFDVPRRSEMASTETFNPAMKTKTRGRILPKTPREHTVRGSRGSPVDVSPDSTSPGRRQSARELLKDAQHVAATQTKVVGQPRKVQDKRSRFGQQKSFSYEASVYAPKLYGQWTGGSPDEKRAQMEEGKGEDVKRVQSYERMIDRPQRNNRPARDDTPPEYRKMSLLGTSADKSESPQSSPRLRRDRAELRTDHVSPRTDHVSPNRTLGSSEGLSPGQQRSPVSPRDVSPRSGGRVRRSDTVGQHGVPGGVSSDRKHRADRRKQFGQQKSFSYEVATTYQPLPNMNGEGDMDYNQDIRGRSIRHKRLIMMQSRTSYSLDDIDYNRHMAEVGRYQKVDRHRQVDPRSDPRLDGDRDNRYGSSATAAAETHYYEPEDDGPSLSPRYYHDKYSSSPRSPGRNMDSAEGDLRYRGRGDVSPRRSGSGSSRSKLIMMHSMRAHDPRHSDYPPSSHTHVTETDSPEMFTYECENRDSRHDLYFPPDVSDDPQTLLDGQLEGTKSHETPDARLVQPDTQNVFSTMRQAGGDVAKDGDKYRKEPNPESTDPDYLTKPVVVGPQPAVLIKPLPRDALRKDRYSEGRPFWKFWRH